LLNNSANWILLNVMNLKIKQKNYSDKMVYVKTKKISSEMLNISKINYYYFFKKNPNNSLLATAVA